MFTLEDEPGTVLVVCQGMPGCQRCENQWGGHIFRWFSMVWSKEYEEMRKEGSWAPGLHDKGRHKACTTWDPLRNRHKVSRDQLECFCVDAIGQYVPADEDDDHLAERRRRLGWWRRKLVDGSRSTGAPRSGR